MGLDVDEAWGDDVAGGIDHRTSRPGVDGARRGDALDAIAGDGDVAVEPGVASAIDDAATGNQDVGHGMRTLLRLRRTVFGIISADQE